MTWILIIAAILLTLSIIGWVSKVKFWQRCPGQMKWDLIYLGINLGALLLGFSLLAQGA